MMQNNMNKYFTLCLIVLSIVLISSCSADYDALDTSGETTVSFVVKVEGENGEASSLTRAVDGVTDVVALIFNQQGYLIGKGEAANVSSLKVTTRLADNCTVCVVANSKAAVSNSWLSNVKMKSDLDNLYYFVLNSGTPKISNVMYGVKTNYSTKASAACTISLQKIYSNFSFSIKIEKDKNTSLGIVLDSYQLCHLPKGTYLCGTKQATTYYDEPEVNLTSSNESGSTIKFTKSILQNPLPKGNNVNSKGWGYRSSKHAPSNASYLKIKAHSQMWQTTFYYYLGGKNLPSTYSSTADYTDYTIYPNMSYNASITINGNGAEEDGNRVNVILQSVTASDLGKIICADGSVYATVAAANAAGKEPVGFIGYVGSDTGNSQYNHGIVFALENANSVGSDRLGYDQALEIAKTYKAAAMKFSTGWHIPSIQEWNHMFAAFGGHAYGVPTEVDDNGNTDTNWDSGSTRQKMVEAGGDPFWEASNFAAKTTFKGDEGYWVYVFAEKFWAWRNVDYPRAVRLCFIF